MAGSSRAALYSPSRQIVSLSSSSEEGKNSSMAMLAMFSGSIIGVDVIPYKLLGPATATLRVLGSLGVGLSGGLGAVQPSAPCSLTSISSLLAPPIPLSWDSASVPSNRGVVSRISKSGT